MDTKVLEGARWEMQYVHPECQDTQIMNAILTGLRDSRVLDGALGLCINSGVAAIIGSAVGVISVCIIQNLLSVLSDIKNSTNTEKLFRMEFDQFTCEDSLATQNSKLDNVDSKDLAGDDSAINSVECIA
ncbi:hypothetical protein phytr_10880 [Candidatus Phycorickettsia trachydisci]|uniref:Uncharacterized protein n=1 Tax=Candidatus Phycorickettsia trachydisci TaxID=2115978 RepID=A0A2P1P9U4_9RICK|nr:hypothetical protein [Candidatus Phycorickettsia trachydisci]AVP88015.1 hypothetical protein phytr_10880 [Candidatus Phycorickettsia trachydisci]